MSALRVLLIEDDEDDYILTRDLLSDGFGSDFELAWASAPERGLELLTLGDYDVALVDYHLGHTTGVELLRAACSAGCRTPVIVLTGQGDRATDLEAMHAGAADYIVKTRVTSDLLERAIRYARERHRLLEQISALSLTDELTGLNNRRAFLKMAEQRLQMLERNAACCVMLFADVDNLKCTNDSQGHEAGDRLLKAAAFVLGDAFRHTDLIARLGGDEFVVLAEIDCDIHVDVLLRRLDDKIRKYNERVALRDDAPQLSISIGALPFTTGPGVSLQHLIAEADMRMLQKKARRREHALQASGTASHWGRDRRTY